MSAPPDDGPFATAVIRAMANVHSGDADPDSPGWEALGIDAAFLVNARRVALDPDEVVVMQRDAIRARITMLLAGGTAPPPADLPRDLKDQIWRKVTTDRLAVERVRRAFINRGPAVRPLTVAALRHAGMDVAAACMAVVANRMRIDIPVRHGIVSLAPLEADRHGTLPEGSVKGEIRAGIPLGSGIRLTTSADMRNWLIIPQLPRTVANSLVGRTLADVVDHPALPGVAPILEVGTVGDVSTDDVRPEDTLILFDWYEEPRTWRNLDPRDLAPIGDSPGKT